MANTKLTDDMRADMVCDANKEKIAEWDAITKSRESEAGA